MSHLIFSILAQSPAPAGAAPGGFNPTPIVYLVCLGAIFYFLTIRPQSQRQKEQDAMVRAIKTGDKVVTSSGIHGMVSNVKETTVIVKIADNVKIEMDKTSIATVKRDPAETAAAS
jgi:preprotein translocase subunit YajC